MRTAIFTVAILFALFNSSFAQNPPPDHEWIGTGRVSARINTNGALVSEFLVPDEDSDSLISTIGEISVWMGGLDPAGNLYLGIQRADTAESDFRGGFRGVTGSAGVWKVTSEEISQHLKDFVEDGDIDIPVSSVFSWPGHKNTFSQTFNGFPLDSVPFPLSAPFADLNVNGIYEPGQGEYPFLGYDIVEHPKELPVEIIFTPFYSKDTPNANMIQMNCKSLFYSYDCDDAAFLEDAVFAHITIQNSGPERLDSLFLSFYINADIGDASDDYMGTLPENDIVYFYNADTSDVGQSPVFAFDSYQGPLDTNGNLLGVYSVMPIYPVSDNPLPFPGTTPPQIPVEYYNYMTGSWRDGSPLTPIGTGYQSGNQPVLFSFPGIPNQPNDWSEISAGNIPGNRQTVLSHGPMILKPNSYNRAFFILENVSEGSISKQINRLIQYSATQFLFFEADFFPPGTSPFDSITCLNTSTTTTPEDTQEGVLFPNPARTQVTLRTDKPGLYRVELLDVLGLTVAGRQGLPAGTNEIELPIEGLPAGFYFFHWQMRDGRRGSRKLLIVK
ncbi:MAG: T9SS type A sorting domain-containing protein [Lewinellaceae bacterium]|nr:T9SS type A sorting domain-containing protein [Lewinellaceae bacterium]